MVSSAGIACKLFILYVQYITVEYRLIKRLKTSFINHKKGHTIYKNAYVFQSGVMIPEISKLL